MSEVGKNFMLYSISTYKVFTLDESCMHVYYLYGSRYIDPLKFGMWVPAWVWGCLPGIL